jgi:hypothetical protein
VKDQLFLLSPGFRNAGLGPFYCGDSVAVEGLLGFCPALRDLVDVHYIAFERPRAALVTLLGEAQQSAPTLVLAEGTEIVDPGVEFGEANGRRFIAAEKMIRRYLSSQYDQPMAG